MKVSKVSKHINIINIHCRKLKFSMHIEHSVRHTVVKVHKNSYVSFCYISFFGSTTSYKVSVLYWDKVGSSERSLLILEVVFGERSHLVQST